MTALAKTFDESRGLDTHSDRLKTLTRREAEVLEHILKGLSNEQVALALFRSPKTIDKHCQNIYRKTRIHNRINLVRETLQLRSASRDRPTEPNEAIDVAVDSLVRKSRAWDKLKTYGDILSRSAGAEYFGHLSIALAETFGVKMAGISEVNAEEGFGDIIAFCADGVLQTPLRYSLENSLCGTTFAESKFEILEDLRERFGDEVCNIPQMGYNSYVGVRLDDRLMGPIGVLWIADDKPIAKTDMAMEILRMFAPAASAELAMQIALDSQC